LRSLKRLQKDRTLNFIKRVIQTDRMLNFIKRVMSMLDAVRSHEPQKASILFRIHAAICRSHTITASITSLSDRLTIHLGFAGRDSLVK
jgi:hypothetical protein